MLNIGERFHEAWANAFTPDENGNCVFNGTRIVPIETFEVGCELSEFERKELNAL